MIDIKVPAIGESITEVTLIKWLKKDGDYVERDEVIAELESEKATFEVNAEKAGLLKTKAAEGDTLNIGDLLRKLMRVHKNPTELQELQLLPRRSQSQRSKTRKHLHKLLPLLPPRQLQPEKV